MERKCGIMGKRNKCQESIFFSHSKLINILCNIQEFLNSWIITVRVVISLLIPVFSPASHEKLRISHLLAFPQNFAATWYRAEPTENSLCCSAGLVSLFNILNWSLRVSREHQEKQGEEKALWRARRGSQLVELTQTWATSYMLHRCLFEQQRWWLISTISSQFPGHCISHLLHQRWCLP